MSEELTKAVEDANALIQRLPIPSTIKWPLGLGGFVFTQAQRMKAEARAKLQPELDALGIPDIDPFEIAGRRLLESKRYAKKVDDEAKMLDAMNQRLEANRATMPKDAWTKIPKASMAWSGNNPKEALPGPRLTGSETADVGN